MKIVKLRHIIIVLTLIALYSCNKPEVHPPNIKEALNQYQFVLKNGNRKQFEQLYFMPLHWRNKEKLLKSFNKQQQALNSAELILQIKSSKQKGRWAVAVLVVNKDKKEQSLKPLWLFYYDEHWQVISPVIFHTATVRSMMNLYKEQEELLQWYQAQAKRIKTEDTD